jgi:hypothetical protein
MGLLLSFSPDDNSWRGASLSPSLVSSSLFPSDVRSSSRRNWYSQVVSSSFRSRRLKWTVMYRNCDGTHHQHVARQADEGYDPKSTSRELSRARVGRRGRNGGGGGSTGRQDRQDRMDGFDVEFYYLSRLHSESISSHPRISTDAQERSC